MQSIHDKEYGPDTVFYVNIEVVLPNVDEVTQDAYLDTMTEENFLEELEIILSSIFTIKAQTPIEVYLKVS